MSQHALITAVGPDRPGLVSELSKFILDCECNIEDSRMAVLGSHFAMLILIQGHSAGIEKVLDGAHGAGKEIGLSTTAKKTEARGQNNQAGSIPYEIDVYSMDHPGIVQQISRFLADRRINVRALDTRLTHAPITGLPLFSLHATIDLPSSEKIIAIRQGLESIGAQENIDIEIKPAGK